jgi:hypothetical protein
MGNKKNINNNKLADFFGGLNFAFCPSAPIKAENLNILDYPDMKSFLDIFPEEVKEKLIPCLRYFYVCYSINIENIKQENTDYFYFQLFFQLGSQQKPMTPFYGFYKEEEILLMIKEIDGKFGEKMIEKNVFEMYNDEIKGSVDEIAELMQAWTDLKLLEFSKLYALDIETITCMTEFLNFFNKKSTKNLRSKRKNNKKNQLPI